MSERVERSGAPEEGDPTLAARVNDRHDEGESLFVEPTPREVHEIMEEAAAAERPGSPPSAD